MSALTKAPLAPEPAADYVDVVNVTSTGLRLPGVGPVTIHGDTIIGIRHDDLCIGLPGSHAIGIALDIAECAIAKTASIDRALLESLILRAIELRRALVELLDEGATHDANEPRKVLQ